MNELREVYLNEPGYTGAEFISNWVQVSSINSVRFSAYSAASVYTQSIEYAVDRNFSIIQTDSTSGIPGDLSVLNSNCVAAYCRFMITGFNSGDDLQLQAFILQSQYLNTGNGATGSTGCTGGAGIGSTGSTGCTGGDGIGSTGSTGCTGGDGIGSTGSTGCTGNFTPLSSTGPTGVLSLVNNSNAVLKGVTGGTGILLNDGTTFLLFSLSQYYIDLITNMSRKYLLSDTTTPASFSYTPNNLVWTAPVTFTSTSGDWTNNGSGVITYNGTPAAFEASIRVRCTSSTTASLLYPSLFLNNRWTYQCMYSGNATAGNVDNTYAMGIAIADSSLGTHPATSILLVPGDTLTLYVRNAHAGFSGTASNFQCNLRIISK